MKRNNIWNQAASIADETIRIIEKGIEGDVIVTMDELEDVKFDAVSNFGYYRRNGQFFIMNTKDPKNYGEDARNYTWYNVRMNDLDDRKKLADYVQKVFGVPVDTSNDLTAARTINGLYKKLSENAKVIDWGACHVTHLPVNQSFLKEGVIYG